MISFLESLIDSDVINEDVFEVAAGMIPDPIFNYLFPNCFFIKNNGNTIMYFINCDVPH